MGPRDPHAAPPGSLTAFVRRGGLRPRAPPDGVARGAPQSPRRSAGLTHGVRSPRGASPPRTPRRRRSWGPAIPTPLRRAHSRRSFAAGGFAPAHPPTASLVGPRDPHAAPPGSLTAFVRRGGLRPRAPPDGVARGAPRSPRRSAGLTHGVRSPRGASPPRTPRRRRSWGPAIPRRSAGLTHGVRSPRGASPPRTPRRRRSWGPAIPTPLRRAHSRRSFAAGGFGPRAPPDGVARGAPQSPRRSAGLTHGVRSPRGASPPRTPRRRRSWGPAIPTPLRRAHSRRSFAAGGFGPRAPPDGVARGAPRSPRRSAGLTHGVRSPRGASAPAHPPTASLVGPRNPHAAPPGSLTAFVRRGGLRPRAPPDGVARGAPQSPRRSAGLTHGVRSPRGASAPAHPPTASLVGPRDPHAAPPGSLTAFVRRGGLRAPAHPPTASLVGPRDPHAAPPGSLTAFVRRGGLRPRAPPDGVARGAPQSPRRSAGLTHGVRSPRGASAPAHPPTASLVGPRDPHAAPPGSLTAFVRRPGSNLPNLPNPVKLRDTS